MMDQCFQHYLTAVGHWMSEYTNRTLLLAVMLLSACGPTTQDAYIRNLEAISPQYEGLTSLPKESINMGESRKYVAEKLNVGQFPWGKSHFQAIQLPAESTPYYLVIKSFVVSPFNRMRYGYAQGDDRWEPWIFFPHIALLDKDSNVISQSQTGDFRMNSNIQPALIGRFAGDSWLQATYRIDPVANPNVRYVVISTSSDMVGKVGAIPNHYWPFSSGFWTSSVIYSPILIPMQTYKGPMHTLHYANIGEIQVQTVKPQHLLQAAYGNNAKLTPIKPGTLIRKKVLHIRAPQVTGYHVVDNSSAKYEHIVLSRDLPAGQGSIAMFAQAFHSKYLAGNPDEQLQGLIKDAIKEHSVALEGFSYEEKPFPDLGEHCTRIDFRGKQPTAFLASIRGYDIVCANETGLVVRIGASILSNPAFLTREPAPSEYKSFINGISFQL